MSTLFSSTDPLDTATYARVVVERGIERAGNTGGGELTYRASGFPVSVGQRVHVPLGRAGKTTAGIVVTVGGRELLAGLHPDQVKPILSASPAALGPGLIELANWMSGYYVCPLGMVFGSLMPAAVKKQAGHKTVIEVRPSSDPSLREGSKVLAALSPKLRKQWAKILAAQESIFPLTPKALAASVEGLSLPAIKKLLAAGLLLSESRQEIAGGTDPLMALASPEPGATTPRVLSDEQDAIVRGVTPALGRFGVHLVRGVTGSGKTEVYLQLIRRVLDADASAGAIVLVPEIALTPQTAQRFMSRFDRVAVLHSGLTPAQRHRQWALCSAGAVRVVVGARSAVFAPLPKVGIVVVDEEHDSSYKQDQLPRYHARDVGIKRAQLEKCPVILGSATPSLESWANAHQGKYALWELTQRVGGIALPRVDIVDIAHERRARAQSALGTDKHFHLLGPTLESALGRTLDAGEQAIVLLNRRGYANYVCCPDARCGWILRCDQCDANLIYHLHRDAALAARGFVRCHHCLGEQLLPKLCPVCAKRVNTFGQGTQRVEEELERKFALSHGLVQGTTLVRVDTDTMHSAADYFQVLSRFGRGEVKVLLGTQMIAKGLDFPNVTLVGVVNADTSLALPDFRAAERTFQLVSQVAGRAGRAGKPGRVIVQTFSPDEPSITLAAAHDFTEFARRELAVRQSAGLPPVTRMARIVCRDEDLDKAQASAKRLAEALKHSAAELDQPVRLSGPIPCPVSRVAGHHRLEVVLIAPSRGGLQSVLARVRAQGLLKSDTHTAVDIDPVAMM